MHQGSPAAAKWVTAHPQEYAVLFDDGALDQPTLEARLAEPSAEGPVALSALARYCELRQYVPADHGKLITRGISRILNACQDNYFGPDHNFLETVNQAELIALKLMSRQLIYRWERACWRYRFESPFAELYLAHHDIALDNVTNPPIKLVLMSAASLLSTTRHPRATPSFVSNWVKNIAAFGPEYVRLRVEERALRKVLRSWITPGVRLDSSRTDDSSIPVPDSTYSPEHVLFGTVEAERAGDVIATLSETAGLTTQQVDQLWQFFLIEQEESPPEIEQLLNHLRSAAVTHKLMPSE